MSNKWKLSGTYFEACNCDAACPCIFLSDPTEDECTALVGWHIEEGHLEDVSLDGLNVVLAVVSPGNMVKVKWDAAIYIDDKADEAQQNALTQIFTGQEGGHLALLVSHVGNVLGIKIASIDYTANGKQRRLRVAGVAEAEIEAIAGQGGKDVTITGHPLCIAPEQTFVVARSKQLTYNDYDLHWEISDKNGFYSPFTYQG